MRLARAAVPLLLLVTVVACGPLRPSASSQTPRSSLTVAPGDADLVVVVTNQSFRDPDIRISVRVDERQVVDGRFAVESQHHFVHYPLRVGAGEHVLVATAGAATARHSFTVPADGVRYAVLSYWHDDESAERFTWSFGADPPVFG